MKADFPGQNEPFVDEGRRIRPIWFEKLIKYIEKLQPLSDIDFPHDDTKSDVIRASFDVAASQDLDADWVGNLVFVGGAPLTITVQPVGTVPLPSGTLQIDFLQFAAGLVQFAAGAGVTIVSKGSMKKLAGVGSTAVLVHKGSNVWYLAGDLTP